MKLIISVVSTGDAGRLVRSLNLAGFRATTIGTTGGFLRQRNTTVLIGTEDGTVPEVLQLIEQNCRTRTQYVNPVPPGIDPSLEGSPAPIEIQLGGAAVFVLEVSQFAHRS
jgi:uncharacterized protein YaaQ